MKNNNSPIVLTENFAAIRRSLLCSVMLGLGSVANAAAPSALLGSSLTIDKSGGVLDGNYEGGYFLNGAGSNLTIQNATVRNFTTTGGSGSGGGAGMGGAIFVGQGSTTTISNVTFIGNGAIGGAGGVGSLGGTLNNRFTNSSSKAGSGADFDDHGFFTGGDGGGGFAGVHGTDSTSKTGQSGGSGGKGSNGWSTDPFAITDVITATVGVVSLLLDIGIESGAVGIAALNPFTANVAAIETTKLVKFGLDAVLAGVDLAVAIANLIAYQNAVNYGSAGLGGDGGAGGNGGKGALGYGGGTGGIGGSGGSGAGNARGGNGGDGGSGGAGGFGAGGGAGGTGGTAGNNGSKEAAQKGAGGGGGSGGFGAGDGGQGSGSGASPSNLPGGGAGGAGLGGAIFVYKDATLNITGNTTFSQGYSRGGKGQAAATGSTIAGSPGGAAGTDLFIMKGANVTLSAGSGKTITFNGSIADDSDASFGLSGVQDSYSTYQSGDGAGLTIGTGHVQFNGANTYTGVTTINTGGVLEATDGTGVNSDSNIKFNGGVFQYNGDANGTTPGSFTRVVGTHPTEVQWVGSGGFAASGGDLTVTLSGGQDLTWGSNSFVPTGSSLIFGSDTATNAVIFTNNINLGSSVMRNIQVVSGSVPEAVGIIQGVFSGDAGLEINTVGEPSAGTLIFQTAHTYTGGTTINAGVLRVENEGALPTTGVVTVKADGDLDLSSAGNGNAGTGDRTIGGLADAGVVHMGAFKLTIDQSANTTFSGRLTDGGADGGIGASLIKKGDGVLTLSGASDYSGSTTVSAGGLILTGAASIQSSALTIFAGASFTAQYGALIPTATTLQLDGTATFNSAFVTIDTLNGSGSLILTPTELVINSGAFSGVISSTGALTKESDDTLTLSGDNTYTGQTTVNAGTLSIASGSSQSSKVVVAQGALFKMASGTSIADTTKFSLDGAVELSQVFQTVDVLNGSSTATVKLITTAFTVNSGTFAGVISDTGSLTKETTGTLILSGSNSYAGQTTINAGILKLGANEVLPDGTGKSRVQINAPGTLDLAGFSETINGLNGDGFVLSSGSVTSISTLTLGNNNATDSFSGVISDGAGKVALTKIGTGTQTLLNSFNTFTGDVNVNAGKLTLSGGTILNDIVAVNIANVNGAIFELSSTTSSETIGSLAGGGTTGGEVRLNGSVLTVGGTNTSTEFAGVITGGIALNITQFIKTGTGTLTLSGTNTFTGDTRIQAGTLELKGGVALNNQVAVILEDNTASTLKVSSSEIIGSLGGGFSGGTVHLYGNTLTTGINNNTTFFKGVITGSAAFGTNNLVKQGAGTMTLSGVNLFTGDLQIVGGTVDLANSQALNDVVAVKLDATANVTLNLSDSETIGSLAGGSVLAGVVKLNGNTLTVGFNNQDTDFAGTVTGTLGNGQNQFVKIGTGRQTLSGTNTFTGDVRIQAGTLVLKNGQALENNVAVVLENVAGAALELATSETIGSLAGGGTLGGNAVLLGNVLTVGSNNLNTQFDGIVSGSLALNTDQFVKIGAGTLTLTGSNTFTGDVNIQAGSLNLVGQKAINDLVAVKLTNSGVTLNLSDSETIGSLAGVAGSKVQLNTSVLTSGTNNNAGVANNTTTYAGVISGSLGLNVTQFIKQGSGTLRLSGTNTFTGDVQIQGGTLDLVNRFALNDLVAVKLDNTAGVVLNLTDSETIGSLNGGTLSLVKLNGQTLYSGINGKTTTYDGIISGSIALNSPTAQFVKQGSGTLTLSGTNTFTGDVQISGGTLNLVGGGAIKDTVAVILDDTANVVLNLTNSETIGSLAGGAASKVQLNGQVFTSGTNNNTTTYAGVISGSLALGTVQFVKQGSGTLTLSGANTFTGDVRIEAGTLDLSGGFALFDNVAVTLLSAANVRLNLSTAETIGSLAGVGPNGLASLNALTLTLGANNTNTEYGGVISGSLTSAGTNLIKIGSGTQTLSGVNTFTGNAYISAGTLDLKGGAAIADTVAVILANFSTANLNLTNSERIGALSGGGLLGGNVSLNANTLTIGGTNTSTTFAGIISGAGALVKEGTGTTTLTGSSTFTGGTTVSVGTLALAASGKLNDAGNVAVTSGATFDISQAISGRTLALLTGGGAVRVGANTLTLGASGDSEFSGTINTGGISNVTGGRMVKAGAGVFTLSGTSNIQTVDVNVGTFKLAGSNNNLTSTATVNVAAGATLALANQNTIGTVNASGALVAALAGGSLTANTYNLTGANVGLNLGTGTVNGSGNVIVTSALNASQINITGGTFTLGLGASLSTAASVNIAAGALLSLDGIVAPTDINPQNKEIFIYALSGSGSIYQGSALLSISGTSTFAGSISSNAALTSGTSSAKATITGDLTVTGSTGTTDVQVASGGTLNLTGNSSSQVQGGLNVASGGNLMISGSSGVNSTDAVVNSGSLMNQGTVTTTDTVTNSGTLMNSGAVTGGSLVNSGVLTNSGSLSGGSLTNTGTINNAGGTVTVSGSTALTNAGTFVNNGSVSGSFMSTGTLTGTGSISGNANVTGTFSPGNSPGELRVGGGTFSLGGALTITTANFELAGTNNVANVALIAGTNAAIGAYYDQVNMVNNGKVVIGGSVDLNLSRYQSDAPLLNLTAGQTFKIIKTADGYISGTFSHIKTGTLASSGALSFALDKGVVFNTWTGELVGTGVAWGVASTWDITNDLMPASLGGWSGLNSNQKAMLTQLNVGERQFHGGDMVKLLLAAPNAEAAHVVLDKASPEAYAGLGDYGLQVGRFHAEQALSMSPLIEQGRWALFGGYAGYGGGSKSSLNRADYDLQSNAGLTGVRLALGAGFDVGLFAAVDNGKVRSPYMSSSVDGQTFGLTAGYNGGLNNPWGAAFAFSGGNFTAKGTRSTNLGTATMDSASLSTIGAILEVNRKLIHGPKYGLSTDLSISFTDASLGAFSEKGAPSGETLSVQGQSPKSLISELGVSGLMRATEQWTFNTRISLGHNFEKATRDVTANVIGEPTRFKVQSPGMGTTHAAISLGGNYQFSKTFSIGANYKATVSSDAQTASSFFLNAGVSF